ncbi:IclR family transcriptional regulator [Pusillimonas sp. SM2304]|uniref:IclR family transcriptional regulator n=1 Tax=Pusillimonas sp. SM2304 TaxID=3073241 RepID=UPI0028763EAB|nr:IclR family transcriptional regulator [Pusillimonas sp. SM2304]MDS1140075.1 IclR family transcriptional regulator [Pusillimonas sp. SM2304]
MTPDLPAADIAGALDSQGGNGSASPTQSLDRAMALLDAVVNHAVQGVSLSVLSTETGLSKPTAHRLLTGLRNAGMVDYHPDHRLFFPSFKLYSMGQAAGARFDVIQLAGPSLGRIASATGDTVYLAIRSGDFAVCVAREIGAFPIKTLTLNVGDQRPLGLGSNSMVLLAGLNDDECERVIARHSEELATHPNFDPASVRHYIARTRLDGYALNEGLMLPEMSAVAMGIRGPGGTIDASISVAAITSRMQLPRRDSIVTLLRREIQLIESQMAIRSPELPHSV